MVQINGDRLLSDLRLLAQFGQIGAGVDRTAFSPQDVEARNWLAARMREAGLEVRVDRVGNVYGRNPKVKRAILIGSHTDTVPNGGWLDGALGVIYGLEIARSLPATGRAGTCGVDVVSFQDEEGTFLPCFGSRTFCNDVSEDEIATARSKDGVSLAAAMASAGFAGAPSRCEAARHVAYLEAHIEQGPRLEAERRRIGVVTGIVGIRRFRVTARGQADHAGTTPMSMRKDAGAALFALASRVASEFQHLAGPDTVWNIGSAVLRPGAANVVPSEAEMTLEFRDVESARLDALERCFLDWVAEASHGGRVTLEALPTARIAPTPMTPALGEIMASVAHDKGDSALFLPSGAGHDAMVVGRFIPAAMLFVPSIGGRSHDPAENTSEEDIIRGCEVLAGTVERLLAKSEAH